MSRSRKSARPRINEALGVSINRHRTVHARDPSGAELWAVRAVVMRKGDRMCRAAKSSGEAHAPPCVAPAMRAVQRSVTMWTPWSCLTLVVLVLTAVSHLAHAQEGIVTERV